MRTEQDYEDGMTVWTRQRDLLDPVYSDERPSRREVIVSLVTVCVVLGIIAYFCLTLL